MTRHVVIVSAVFPPEPVVSAHMSRDLAQHLASDGIRVTVLCPPASRPLGIGYDSGLLTKERPSGSYANPRVITLNSRVSPHSRIFSRIGESWSFGRAVARYLCSLEPKPDAIYANTWPVLSQLLVARLCSARSIPFILHVQDMYPEAVLHRIGAPLRTVLQWPLLVLDRSIVRRASRVVLISDKAERHFAETRRLPKEKLATVRNWADESLYSSMPDREVACRQYGVPVGRCTFLFLGNIGPLAEVERLIAAFVIAQPDGAQLVIAGDGVRKAACQELVRQMGVARVYFISEPRAEMTPYLLAMADICLLPLRKGASRGSVPSKLIAYLFAAKPVLASVDDDSDAALCLSEAGGGWCGPADDTEWLAKSMVGLAAHSPMELMAVGAAGRRYGLKIFSRARGAEKLAGIVTSSFLDPTLPSR